tara:strand:- start:174 stop:554 length:381 start_codon:yes stop_codon:yes gene_type:complete
MGYNGKKPDPEKRKQYLIKYRQENKEKRAKYNSEFKKTDIGKKTQKISSWKGQGLICDDYDKVYERYINSNHCECCGKEYKNQRDKHMDHCHKTGKFRNILCRNCNQLRGHIDKDYKLIMKLITMC